MSAFTIEPVRSADDLAAIAKLFREYAAALGIDLGYQEFEKELASLPGKYAAPQGELLLARGEQGEPVGCAALRPIEPEGCCEMKRLYVSPEGRGKGMGRALMDAVIDTAVRIGYREMRLDTLPTLTEAISLYRKGGFLPIPPYNDTPIRETLFMARSLV